MRDVLRRAGALDRLVGRSRLRRPARSRRRWAAPSPKAFNDGVGPDQARHFITLTVTPCGPTSFDSTRLRPSTPALVATYAESPGAPLLTVPEETLTIRP